MNENIVLNVFLKKTKQHKIKNSVNTGCFYFVLIIKWIKQYFKKSNHLWGRTVRIAAWWHIVDRISPHRHKKKELQRENMLVHSINIQLLFLFLISQWFDWLMLRCWLEPNAFWAAQKTCLHVVVVLIEWKTAGKLMLLLSAEWKQEPRRGNMMLNPFEAQKIWSPLLLLIRYPPLIMMRNPLAATFFFLF